MRGRPTKYTPEALEKARDYLKNYREGGDVIPTVPGLALALGISRETVYAWSKDEDKEEFTEIYLKLMADQERQLVNSGLKGDFNSAITKMILTKHDYSDKVQTDNTHSVSVVEITKF